MRRAFTFLLLVGLLLFTVSSAFASGAETFTQTFHNFTEPLEDVSACTGEPISGTITYNGVIHSTLTPNGGFHVTGTFTGDFEGVLPDGTTASGHFTTWFGDNFNTKNENHTFTFTVHGSTLDGEDFQWHITAHLSTNAQGEVVVDFFKLNCP